MAIEIVSFSSYKMVIFHSYVKVYQRVAFNSSNGEVEQDLMGYSGGYRDIKRII